MLKRDPEAQEGYIHVCDDSHKYTKQALAERLPIYLHDVKSYTIINNKLVPLKYCPYCGVNVESEER